MLQNLIFIVFFMFYTARGKGQIAPEDKMFMVMILQIVKELETLNHFSILTSSISLLEINEICPLKIQSKILLVQLHMKLLNEILVSTCNGTEPKGGRTFYVGRRTLNVKT